MADIVVVEHVYDDLLPQAMENLEEAGLHPIADTRQRLMMADRAFPTTAIYVPEGEETRAREVLADWHYRDSTRVAAATKGLARDLVVPTLVVVIVAGVAWFVVSEVASAIVAIVCFLPAHRLWSWWRRMR